MNTELTLRRVGLAVSGAAIAASIVAGCTAAAKEAPPQNAPVTTLNPTGPNSFTPTVVAPGAPTALPGNVVTGS